ncbi:lipopolysaccharide biosynthesis protein [Stappia sp.]|uniref:lipopolysaccharide biosynthesis protein n=1 Tax=Stappia sp. TaxID=1870903 RepID=UPI003A9A2035
MNLRKIAGSAQARRLAEVVLSRGLSTLFSFLLLYVTSQILSLDEYGLYVFLFSVGSALGLMAGLGQPMVLVKHFRAAEACDGRHNASLIRGSARVTGAAVAVLGMLGSAAFFFGSALPERYEDIHLAAAFAAVFVVSEYLQSFFRVRAQYWLALGPRENIWRPLASVVLLAGSAFGLSWAGADAFIVVGASLLVAILPQLGVYLRQTAGVWRGGGADFGGGRRRLWRREGLYFFAHTGFAASAAYLETVIIGLVVGLREAAFFFLVTRLTMLLNLPGVAIETVGVPRVAEKFRRNDRQGAQDLIACFSLIAFVLALCGGLVLLIVAPALLGLFNPAFTEHFEVVVIMTLSVVAHAYYGIGTSALMVGGGERYYLSYRTMLFGPYVACLIGSGWFAGLDGVALTSLAFVLIENVIAARWCLGVKGVDLRASSFRRAHLVAFSAGSGARHARASESDGGSAFRL